MYKALPMQNNTMKNHNELVNLTIALIEKLIDLGPNDWPKSQNYLKDIYPKETV